MEEVASVGRLGQRAWLLANTDLLQAEAIYHRAHHDEERQNLLTLWRWGDMEGLLKFVVPE
jgi:hypothetical protein